MITKTNYKVYSEKNLIEFSKDILNYFGSIELVEQYWYSNGNKQITELAKNQFNLSYYYFEKICIDIFHFKKRTKEQIKQLKQLAWSTFQGYSEEKKESMNKTRSQTCLIKYGKTNIGQVEDIKAKIAKTTFDRYGVTNINSLKLNRENKSIKMLNRSEEEKASIRKKVEETNLKKYGVKNTFELVGRIENTKEQKYGDSKYNNRDKAESTTLQRYGVKSYSQVIQQSAKFKLYEYDNTYFDSFPELAVYMYFKNTGHSIKRANIRFEYTFNNELHYYFPDFIIDGNIVEIKGNHLYKKMLIKNTIDNAKYNCLIENKVSIWNTDEYTKYIEWFNKQGFKKEDFKRKKMK